MIACASSSQSRLDQWGGVRHTLTRAKARRRALSGPLNSRAGASPAPPLFVYASRKPGKRGACPTISCAITRRDLRILTGASLDKAGASHPLPFEPCRDYLVRLGRARLNASERSRVKLQI